MKPKMKGKILAALRQLFLYTDVRKNTLKRAKVNKGIFQCEICKQLVYDGKSDKVFKKHKEQLPGIIQEHLVVDHIDPVVPTIEFTSKDWSWDIIISRLFCYEDGLQAICKKCHKKKTDEENKIRRKK